MEFLNKSTKAKNLSMLSKHFRVPKFISISASEISAYLKSIKITDKTIKEAFEGSINDRDRLRKKITEYPFKYSNRLRSLSDKIIVRSAAIGEDGRFSFAGIYESKKSSKDLLNINITFVIQSAFSERVYYYARNIGLQSFPKLSLIIQNYIESQYGGVAFSTTIYKGKKGTLINAVKGSAENAVLGKNVSEIFVSKKVPRSKIPSYILHEVFQASKKIEKMFKNPQDIEWCYADKLYILQSRSITKNIRDETVWDNSNIAESYAGIVLPLTCSFAQFIYAKVYRDVARTSNIKEKKIRQNAHIFDNLLGFHYGRFYYNMNNWYKMLTLFPGYTRNKKNLNMMISAKSKLELDQRHRKNVSTMDNIAYYIHIARRMITFEKDLARFKKQVKDYLKRAKQKNLDKLSLEGLWGEFEEYQKNLLDKWSITVDNDFLAMTWFGLYNKYAKSKGLTESQTIRYISDLKSAISAQQVHHLQHLAKNSFTDKALSFAKNKQWNACYKEIITNPKIAKNIHQYLEIYGGRFANELKLEAKVLDSDPTYLAELLYTYKQIKIQKDSPKTENPGFLLNSYARKTKHYLKHREENRLLRSQAFSFARRLFIAIGNKLAKQKRISQPHDIFYLTLHEIRNPKQNDLKKIVRKRKKEYKTYASVKLDDVIIGTVQPSTRRIENSQKSIKGVGCSQGRVTGKVKIMKTFELPKKLDIVVVKHTDPGWTPLFGLCKGLIVENGGLLSHAAIISRELGLPCIIGVKNATKIFKNGQKVTMDASKGTVEIVE